MEKIIIWIINITFLVGFIFNIYWQSQIVIKAKYKYTPAIFSVILVSWMIEIPSMPFEYIILVAGFLTISIMNGVGGIGEKKLVSSGFFSNVFEYSKLSRITLIPIDLGAKNRVVAIFNTETRQSAQMIFNNTVTEVREELKKHVPESTSIEIGQIQ